jgi:DNA-binding NarL/FixJ family response regulator
MIRIFIVEKAALNSALLNLVLESEANIEVVGMASRLDDKVLAQIKQADVVLINTALVAEDASALVRAVSTGAPGVRILVTGLADSERESRSYLEAGAAGYVVAGAPVIELLNAIRAVASPTAA